ncbi:hypothetical protein N7490_006379 [Penicillium lividum]|nr:hypothetical protein N7490_006379 [Penicillium lividum]
MQKNGLLVLFSSTGHKVHVTPLPGMTKTTMSAIRAYLTTCERTLTNRPENRASVRCRGLFGGVVDGQLRILQGQDKRPRITSEATTLDFVHRKQPSFDLPMILHETQYNAPYGLNLEDLDNPLEWGSGIQKLVAIHGVEEYAAEFQA